jgi:ketosteroid isomerase-like protein
MMISELFLVSAALVAAPEITNEVVCAETSFSRAAERKDRQAFIEFVDPDARFIADRIARGREEIAAAWSFAFREDGTDMRWRPATVEVSSDGMLAISRGPYRATSRLDDGTVVENWGTFISTWRRNADGRWQVLFDTGGETGMTPSADDIAVLNQEPECDQGVDK